jgi:hypothetical protein
MDYTALYLADSSLIGSKTLDNFSDVIRSYRPKSENENAVGMIIELDEAVIDCNFMPEKEINNHLQGLNGFVKTHLQDGISLSYPLARIYNVNIVIGCSITPKFDTRSKVLGFMKNYNNFLRSMIFYEDALWDYDWQCLASIHTNSS